MVSRIRSFLGSLGRDERGLTTVEYVIVLALIAVVCVGTWNKFGAAIEGYISGSTEAIDDEMPDELKAEVP
jgi:Flp pilus assembly pilin Flp